MPDWKAQVFAEIVAPQVLVFRQFLSQQVAQRVIDELEATSQRFDSFVSGERANQDHLLKREGAALACLGAAESAFSWPAERWGAPIVRDTQQGADFSLHFDAFNRALPDDERFLKRFGSNHRIGTLLIYLDPAGDGGATYFANLSLRVNLNAGDAVYFGYDKDGMQQSGLLHGGEVVKSGRKRIMTLFCYERALVAVATETVAVTKS